MVPSCCLRSCGPIGSKFVIESGYYACCPLLVLRRVQLHILQSPFHSPNDRQDAAKQLVVLVGVLGGAFRFLILPAVLAKRLLRIGRGDSCRSVTVDSPSLKSPPHRCCLPISWPNSAPPIFAKGPPLRGGGGRERERWPALPSPGRIASGAVRWVRGVRKSSSLWKQPLGEVRWLGCPRWGGWLLGVLGTELKTDEVSDMFVVQLLCSELRLMR